MNKKEWKKIAEKLVCVTAGKNSFIGEFSAEWDGGKIVLREAIATGTRQIMVDAGNGQVMPAQLPSPGLLPWLVNEAAAELEIVPDHLWRLSKQSAATQEAAAEMYTEFCNYLREARENPDQQVQLAGPEELAKLQQAQQDPNSLLSKFGPLAGGGVIGPR